MCQDNRNNRSPTRKPLTMNLYVGFVIITSLVEICLADLPNDNDLIIETTKGKVQGYTDTAATARREQVDCWMGIPFADPPIGNLRFRHPRPISRWDGIKSAKEKPNSCPQIIATLFPDFAGSNVWNQKTALSEDCLYLNIVVPRPRPQKAAVMIWIHGGDFYSGSSTLDIYDYRTLAVTEGVIVASIQYRLGGLGFLYFGTAEAPGNAGMFDQIMALEFIKNNIERFGGDPENITLVGRTEAALHLLSPLSRSLFNRAILQSGSPTAPHAILSGEESIIRGIRLADAVNCPHDRNRTDEVIDCLRKVNASELMANEWGTLGLGEVPFSPILDNTFLDEFPDTALTNGHFKQTPLLLGSNLVEGNYLLIYYLTNIFRLQEIVLVEREDFLQSVREVNPHLTHIARQAVIFEYTDWLNPHDPVRNRDNLDKIVGDKHITCPVNEVALRYAEAGNYVYRYQFTHRSSKHLWPPWTGVMHGDEIPFVFGAPLNPAMGYTAQEEQLSRFMMKYWANFAKTGNPSLNRNGTWSKVYWPVHTVFGREYMELIANDTKNPKINSGPRIKQCIF